MAGDAANVILGAIFEKAITPLVDAIGRQLGYILCYKNNIENLGKLSAQLEESRNDADNFFKRQKWNNEEIPLSSVGWLEEVKKVINDAKEVEEATAKRNGCLNLKGRYIHSRKSSKLAVEMQALKNKAPKGITTNTILPAGRIPGALANEASKGYKTRMQTMDEVMKALEDHAISVIGICGLGGVGKTTMVHEVREKARIQNLFDEIAMATVSQNEDLFKIQGDLAEMLGLNAIKEEKNVIARADQLRKRLTSGNKVLIILDDVWSDINLKDVGIPLGSEHSNCKVVITSRQEGVCTYIQKNIEIRVLAKEEARALFRKTAGELVEKNNLGEIADEVADECGGLPIALLTLSRALSNKDRKTWEDARTKLREGHFTGIHGMEKHVYQSIKLSYDFLAKEKLEEAQLLLLLCCQHQEDAKINLEKLARYCMALDLFKGVNGVVRARNRVYSLVEHLKSCFLLQAIDADGEDGDRSKKTVKVHDVVRDVCLSIVSTVKEERDKVYMHIWNKEDDAGIGSTDLDYQKLKLLLEVPLYQKDLSGIKSVLEQTRELRVLESAEHLYASYHMDEKNDDPSLAPQFLTNLRMLSLEDTRVGPDMMVEFIRLTELEILSFTGSIIVSFPHEIGKLSKLKLLDLRCRYDDWKPTIAIPSGILEKLTKLEVLFMGNHYFTEAPGEADVDIESFPARIEELDSLTNLTTLQVDLVDPMQLLDLKYLRFEKLEGFSFGSVGKLSSFDYSERSYPLHMKNICLKEVGMEWVLEDKIQSIVRSTVDLSLEDIEDLTDTSIFKQFSSLRKLVLRKCHKLEYIIHDGSSDAFMNMETLSIHEMRNVRELCHNVHLPAGLLHKLRWLYISGLPEVRHLWVDHTDPLRLVNLKVVEVKECGALKCIFPNLAACCLSQLQRLDVRDCCMLEGIVSKGREGNSTERCGEITEESNDLLIHFPKLTKVTIIRSPNVRGFYNLDDGRGQSLFNPLVKLPSIEDLEIYDNESIKAVFDFEGSEAMTMREDERSLLCMLQKIDMSRLPKLEHLFRKLPKDVLIFQNLATLKVEECGNLAYLIPSSIAHMLVNLQVLEVGGCKGMKEVISKMNEDCEEVEKKIVFRSLRDLSLLVLGSLSSFCSSDQLVLEFPSLEMLAIYCCPELKTFCFQERGSDLAALFPKLKDVYINEAPKFRGFDNIDSYEEGYQNLVNLELRAAYQLNQMMEEGGDNLVKVAASSSLNLVQNLDQLNLEKCEAIKSVLDFEGFDVTRDDAHALFNRLEIIRLHHLSNLEHICRLIPKEINGFQTLSKLDVCGCDSLSYLLTSTMARMLLNLKSLKIWKCKSMKEVVKMNDDCGEDKIVFRSLHLLEFVSLEKLASFCSVELQEFDFPSLKIVIIHKCPAMMTFCCGHLTADKLQGVYFNDESDEHNYDDDVSDYYVSDKDKVFWKGDVNETIRHFSERANRMKRDLKEDGVDENDDDEARKGDVDDIGDKPHSENVLNETTQHLNASDLNKDEIDASAAAVDGEGEGAVSKVVDENAQGDNEERSEVIVGEEASSKGIIEPGSTGVHIIAKDEKFEKLSQRLDAKLIEMQQLQQQFQEQTQHQLSQIQHQLSQLLVLLHQQTGTSSDGGGGSGT